MSAAPIIGYVTLITKYRFLDNKVCWLENEGSRGIQCDCLEVYIPLSIVTFLALEHYVQSPDRPSLNLR